MGSCNPTQDFGTRELNILLVGPKRTGKSSSGNTLLGQGQVFETRGGGASTAASANTAGCHMRVVDTLGWSSTEELVPQKEKTELLYGVSLCGQGGPHAVLLVIPLLDFTESERRAVEIRMEILTSMVWRHTMVLFTCGDRLKRAGRSVEDHIQSGGPALNWLMEKCRHRYHVFDNKAAERQKQEVEARGRKQQEARQRNAAKRSPQRSKGGEADGRKDGEQEQVRELLIKVENMLLENGGWHFSLYMYLRMEEDWKRRERELRALLEAEMGVGSVSRQQKTAETKINIQQGLETEKEEQGKSLRKEQGKQEERVERKMNTGGDEEERARADLRRLRSEDDGYDSRGDGEESTEARAGLIAPRQPNGGQSFAFSPGRRLA